MKEQKKFEKWLKDNCAIAGTKKSPSGEYAESITYWAWRAWQEALAQNARPKE
jgi:hypothetical protein